MAIDPAQLTQLTPEEALLAKVVSPQVRAIADTALSVVNTAVNTVQTNVNQVQTTIDAHGGALGILQSTADAHSAQIAALEQKVGSALVKAAVDNAKEIVIILVVGAVVGLLALWIAYLAGSTRAADTVLAIPGGMVALATGLGLYFRAMPGKAAV